MVLLLRARAVMSDRDGGAGNTDVAGDDDDDCHGDGRYATSTYLQQEIKGSKAHKQIRRGVLAAEANT